jgi:hypothetical protein
MPKKRLGKAAPELELEDMVEMQSKPKQRWL